MVKVSASFYNGVADFSRLADEIKKADDAGVDMIHVDVMDGVFVPNIFFGQDMVKAIRKETSLPFDTHLMKVNPERNLESWAEAGCDYITVCAEAAVHLHRLLMWIKELGKKAGVSLNPATPLSAIEYVLDELDMLLIMTVNPGFYGQTFIKAMIPKIECARKMIDERGLKTEISVDGNMKEDTTRMCVDAGADIAVYGSGLWGAKDMKKAVQLYKKIER